MAKATKKVFEGIKIAEFAWVAAGPQSSRYLADHGAIVVTIESHTNLDLLRLAGPFPENIPGLDRSMFFGKYNANKYGVSLDLNHPQGIELAWRLIKWADIMTESFRPGTMKKWGLDYHSVSEVKPEIIYLSTSLQGNYGSFSRFGGTGELITAVSGYGEMTGWSDRVPLPPYGAYSDYLCQRFNGAALIAALEYRRRTGKGQWIEQSQLESSLHFLAPVIMEYIINGVMAHRNGNRYYNAAPHGVFPCKGEDRWVVIAVFTDEEWQAFCNVIGNPDWVQKAEFSTFLRRKENEDKLERLVAEWTLKHVADEIENALQNAGVCAHKVAKGSDLFEDPQLGHRKFYVRLNHPEMGRPAYQNQAGFLLSKTPREIIMPSPCLGQHNEYVYKELLGMSDEEIAEHIVVGSITTQLPGGFQVSCST